MTGPHHDIRTAPASLLKGLSGFVRGRAVTRVPTTIVPDGPFAIEPAAGRDSRAPPITEWGHPISFL